MIARKCIYFLAILFFIPTAGAQDPSRSAKIVKDGVSCNEFAPVVKQVIAQPVGVEQCSIISEETVFNIKGQRFRRVEVRLSGTVDGWASREKGSRAIYFTDGPDFVLTQSGLAGPRSRGVGKYEAATGHGLTILYPEDGRNWNGKLFITAHGAGSYGAVGALIPRDPNSKFNALADVNRYVGLMIDKGYAVAHTMRSSDRTRGDITNEARQLQSQFPCRVAYFMGTTGSIIDCQTTGSATEKNLFLRALGRRIPRAPDQLPTWRESGRRWQAVL